MNPTKPNEVPSVFIASSPWFIAIATIFYASMTVALWIAYIPWWLSLVVTGLLLLDCSRVIRLHGLRTHKNSVGILRQDCDKWQYQLHSGKACKGTLVKQRSYCSRILIVLYFKHLNFGRYIIIPRDSLSEHNFRLLAFKLYC